MLFIDHTDYEIYNDIVSSALITSNDDNFSSIVLYLGETKTLDVDFIVENADINYTKKIVNDKQSFKFINDIKTYTCSSILEILDDKTVKATNVGCGYITVFVNQKITNIPVYVLGNPNVYSQEAIVSWTLDIDNSNIEDLNTDKLTITHTKLNYKSSNSYDEHYIMYNNSYVGTFIDTLTSTIKTTNITETITIYIPSYTNITIGEDIGENIPNWVIQEFYSDDFVCVVQPTNTSLLALDKKTDEYNVLAYFSDCPKSIVLRRFFDSDDTISHEIGHYISWKAKKTKITSKNAAETSDFMEIYEEEKDLYDLYNVKYSISSSTEYFAECYARYLIEPDNLKNTCPNTYDYIDDLIDKLENKSKFVD
jgi:hypothetical protein